MFAFLIVCYISVPCSVLLMCAVQLDCLVIVAVVELGEAPQCHQQSAIDSHRSLAMCRAAQHSTAVRIVSVTIHLHMARPHPCSHRTHRLSATQGAPHPFSQNCHPDSPSGEYKTSFPTGEVIFCLKIILMVLLN